ncbi:hypothetical protein BaRGS_00007041 [Batillaria attramentaria]|uniref:Uncharacterized protein n=1 Tax=Batillaria attramentaria TaxID=370345 RepID=A0ABD0LQ46_9CAEN
MSCIQYASPTRKKKSAQLMAGLKAKGIVDNPLTFYVEAPRISRGSFSQHVTSCRVFIVGLRTSRKSINPNIKFVAGNQSMGHTSVHYLVRLRSQFGVRVSTTLSFRRKFFQ